MRGLRDVFVLAIVIVGLWICVLHVAAPETEQPASPVPAQSAVCAAFNDGSAGLMAYRDERNAIKDAACPGQRPFTVGGPQLTRAAATETAEPPPRSVSTPAALCPALNDP